MIFHAIALFDAYVGEQKKLGRFQRPLNNRLLPVMQWLDEEEVVDLSEVEEAVEVVEVVEVVEMEG